VHPDDGGKVAGSKPVAAAEHGERDFPCRGLAFQPALLHPQDLGGFLRRVQGKWISAVMCLRQTSSSQRRIAQGRPTAELVGFHEVIITVMRITF
jgi:hypothetical protein